MKELHQKIVSVIIVLAFLIMAFSCQQVKAPKTVAIGFYNLENLFDTINDVNLFLNEEFTPESKKKWTSSRYQEKLSKLAYVISSMAKEDTPDGLVLLGVCEVENIDVLEDLVLEPSIKERNYQIVHFDSPDARGIDVGLLYNPQYFEVLNSKSHKLSLPDDSSFLSRDQLVVSGMMNGKKYHVVVNHWPSRRGGEEKSRHKRNAAGDLSRHIVDSLLTIDMNAKILVMGDFNDDPVNESVLSHLRASGDRSHLTSGDLYNPMYQLYMDSLGTICYRNKWNLFDMIIVSKGLLGEKKSNYQLQKTVVFDKDFLKQKDGKYAGYPDRTYAGKKYLGGYSDHFPVYIIIGK